MTTGKHRVLLIARSHRYSPNSVERDRLIFEAVRDELVRSGAEVVVAEEGTEYPDSDIRLSMARGEGGLCNESRKKMHDLLTAEGVHFVETKTHIADVSACWIKRDSPIEGLDDSVRYAKNLANAEDCWQDMQQTAPKRLVWQPHIEGDLVKFYGVEGTGFFRIYYADEMNFSKYGNEKQNGTPQHYAFDRKAFQQEAEHASRVLTTPIYGGDAIIQPDGRWQIIDFNDWPSFSPCREEAAKAIVSRFSKLSTMSILTTISTSSKSARPAPSPRAYIFDYGGTLDTGGEHWASVIESAWEKAGINIPHEQFWEAYVHAERYLGKNRVIEPTDTFRETLSKKLTIEMRYAEDKFGVSALPYHQTVLDTLYQRTIQHTTESRIRLKQLSEHYPMALVSNFYGNIHTVLREFGMDGLFSHVIESAVVGIRKPDPRIFQMAVDLLGFRPEETVVVGDSYEKDIVPAQQTGCQTIWIQEDGIRVLDHF